MPASCTKPDRRNRRALLHPLRRLVCIRLELATRDVVGVLLDIGVPFHPEGTGRGPKSWEMAGSETPSRMPDVLFIAELIDKLGASYNIDKTRIYASGMSNGGGMAFVLSCTLSDGIAAVGMVSAGLDPDWNWCTDHRPVPVIAFHGTGDPICPYNGGPSKLGGGTFPNVPEFFAKWSRRNQCGRNAIESVVAPDVTRLQYTGCANEAGVVLYTTKGEGHQWPGGRRIAAEWMLGPYSHSIEATRQMWAFFHKHRLTRE
jgi:polyhydroxybutyrate depolymerase